MYNFHMYEPAFCPMNSTFYCVPVLIQYTMTLPLCKIKSPIGPNEKEYTLIISWHMIFGVTQTAKGNLKKTPCNL